MVGTGDGIDLLRALGSAYMTDHPETNVIVPPSIGSGGGIAAVNAEKEVLARIARPLSDSDACAAARTQLEREFAPRLEASRSSWDRKPIASRLRCARS